MSQFGASTIIGPRTRLILADCYETLIALGPEGYHPRTGVVEFLDHYCLRLGIPLSVVTDADGTAARAALGQAGLLPRIGRIWHAGDAIEVLPNGRRLKRLDTVLAGEGVEAAQTVFIGDSQLDAEAALRHHVPFIRVPRSEDAGFSFAVLISGPSRYSSGHFSAALIDSLGGQAKDHRP
jgi:phosphoglycolate phosphatase-like HAD superfamily hydrolase